MWSRVRICTDMSNNVIVDIMMMMQLKLCPSPTGSTLFPHFHCLRTNHIVAVFVTTTFYCGLSLKYSTWRIFRMVLNTLILYIKI